jgi:hypothetical protein
MWRRNPDVPGSIPRHAPPAWEYPWKTSSSGSESDVGKKDDTIYIELESESERDTEEEDESNYYDEGDITKVDNSTRDIQPGVAGENPSDDGYESDNER